MWDGITVSLTAWDGRVLSRGHWINYRRPSPEAGVVIDRLLASTERP